MLTAPSVSTSASQVYTDLNGLQSINKLGQTDRDAALMEVAKQFESMFLNMMLSSMRQANKVFEEDSLFNTPETDFFQKMYDDQMSVSMAGQQGMGLAETIHAQLMRNYGQTQEPVPLNQGKLFDRRVTTPLQQAIDDVDEVLKDMPAAPVPAERGSEYSPEPVANVPAQANTTTNTNTAATTTTTTTAQGHGGKGQQFATPAEFVAALYPHAQVIGERLNVEPRAIVAQAALETGWGKHMIQDDQGRNSYNFFGIKADQRWSGESVEVTTHEYRHGIRVNEKAEFRAYASLEDGMNDYANFLRSGRRYEQAIDQGLDERQYGFALQQAGYATDPLYGQKIKRIANSSTLLSALEAMQQNTHAAMNNRVSEGRNDG